MAGTAGRANGRKQVSAAGFRRRTFVLALATLAVMVVVMPPMLPLMAVGLLPTVVALMLEPTTRRGLSACVFAANAGGVVAVAATLHTAGGGFATAIAMIRDGSGIVTMFAAAAAGWLVNIAVPPAIQAFEASRQSRRLARYRQRRTALAAVWDEGKPADVPPA